LHANGGTSEQIYLHADQGTGLESIKLLSDVGGIKINAAGLANAAAIDIQADAGGIDMDSALQFSIASSQDAGDAIAISASAGGMTFSATGEPGQDIDIINLGGSVNIQATENVANAIVISASLGGIDISANGAAGEDIDITNTGGSINVSATENDANCIVISENGGINGKLNLSSLQGTSPDSVNISSTAGGVTMTGALASADAINIVASNAAGGIDIDSGTGGFIVDSTGAISLDGALASNFTVTGAGADITVNSTGGRVVVDGGEAAADAIRLNASNAAGGIDVDAGTGGINYLTTGVLSLNSSKAAADAINITASDAAGAVTLSADGGIALNASGNLFAQSAKVSIASPTAVATLDFYLGTATFTGFTTAAGSSQTFTINSIRADATSNILVTVANEGSNDAQMTITRVKRAAGSFDVTVKNNGTAALNGDVSINFWIATTTP
jgi:hypothetical protein